MHKALWGVLLSAVVLVAIGALPSPAEAPGAFFEQPVGVLFVGDLMLDRNVARAASTTGAYALLDQSVITLFKEADLRVANLEGTITTNPSVAQKNNTILRFTFEPGLARQVLTVLNLDAVSSANNHALDFGEFGLEDTRAYLGQWGVQSFGQPFNESHLSTALTARGKSICLVGYMALFDAHTDSTLAEIARVRPGCWRVVVFAHWGEEYAASSTPAQVAEGHAFIDAGADVVVGAHPHVVEPYEIYKGKAIFYSLGNFIFDQDFSLATTHGEALRVEFGEEETAFSLIPLSIQNQRSAVASGAVARFRLP